jgi:hypothetical protein
MTLEPIESIARRVCTYGYCATCKDPKLALCPGGQRIAQALQTERDRYMSVISLPLPDCGSCDCVFMSWTRARERQGSGLAISCMCSLEDLRRGLELLRDRDESRTK